ncbi:MAG: hypothetical protein MJ151_03540, partial [Lachnospiraceae bacterium]|nr:hypothetical protein [Lachnospiraceae bacterium]
MNIKRPSIIFVLCAIVGIILAYNKINVIDKGLVLSITFLLLLFLIYKKKMEKSIVVVCLIFVA